VGILKILYIFVRERPRILFSTGAEIAIPSFYIGKFVFHTRLIYLECSAQVYNPSLTGRWVYPISDLFLVQWEPLLTQYGSRAKYVGGLI
jgi:UDP-N-acetylglucosamine:LPS N-acetylglucosamine transferase